MSKRIIRAQYDDNTITVYQAYNNSIGLAAARKKTFAATPFKMERMTWIKPSFLWMMYRSGWATKADQECILAIKIKRDGLTWALENSCLAKHYLHLHATNADWQQELKRSPVRIQWDPEKDINLQELPYRSIQIGISGIAVEKYVSEWITDIEDITANCKHIYQLLSETKTEQARELLPVENYYPLPPHIVTKINATEGPE
ncbi:DUF4291 domain-containing protein [Niastella sp. OAS944]|uniref:DUF4291 domain-containing protein n=1 Tax=Niastella sp. OAS944 TaxID=2664089 RepID=UPI00348594F1|nr:hypothetical protein [Chitinophagaceae bacterium OAS944]